MPSVRDPDKVCGAKKPDGKKCQNWKGYRTDHPGLGACFKHFGNAKPARVAAELTRAVESAKGMGAPIDINPFNAILVVLRDAAGDFFWLQAKVAELESSDILGYPTTTKTRPLNLGNEGEDPNQPVTEVTRDPIDLHVWIKAKNQAGERLAKYGKMALDAGVDDRLVKIEENQVRLFATTLHKILREGDIPVDAKLLGIMKRNLSVIDSTCVELPLEVK